MAYFIKGERKMNINVKKFFCRFLLILMFFVEQVGLAFALIKVKNPIGIILLLVSVISVIFLQIWYQKLTNVKLSHFSKHIKTIVFLLIILLITEEIISQFSSTSANQQFINHMLKDQNTKWIMTVLGIVIAPIVEEGAFRTGIMGNTKHPIILGTVSTMLFVCGHMVSTNQSLISFALNITAYALISVVLCFLYYRTKDWRVNTVFHISWNLLAFVTSAIF